eukprot:Sspe_Gene.41521::Locus_20079_Transcript_1_1_Confidence_1.000_Length_1750::g.41521::m.41521/K20410/MAPKAP1, SIN1; target of rapamycin complex 2 subunit MAPKAP1
MFFHLPPETPADASDSKSFGKYAVPRRTLSDMKSSSRAMARSLSPPAEEDLIAIGNEAGRLTQEHAIVPARTKDVDGTDLGTGDEKGEKGGTGKDGGGDGDDWCLEPVEWARDPPPPPPSEIHNLLTGGGGAASPGRTRQMNLQVFCPFLHPEGGGKMVPWQVQVSEQANVHDVIKATLRKLRERDPSLSINPNPDAYRLRVADDDNSGKPDEDLPVLDKKTGLRRTGFDKLVLCEVKGSRHCARPSAPKTLEDVLYRIFLGSVERNRTRRATVPPDLLYKDALGVICEKLKKDPSRYSLRLVIDGVEKDSLDDEHSPVGERTLGTLRRKYGVTELCLRSKGRDDDDVESDTEIEPPKEQYLGWDEASASRYTEYKVIKINKYGARQERILGIDREKIYNSMPTKKMQKTKNPERSISDITHIRLFEDKPNYCEIEYRNNRSGKDQIECQNQMEAHEITSKVRYLLDLHRASQNPSGAAPQPKYDQDSKQVKFMKKFAPLHSPSMRGDKM